VFNFRTTPSDFSAFKVYYLSYFNDYVNALDIQLTTGVDIPVGGYVEIAFHTKDYKWPFDLGIGMRSNEVKDYAGSITATHGSKVDSVTVTAGTTVSPAKIRFTFGTLLPAGENVRFYLPNLKNGAYAGLTPTYDVTSYNAKGAALETKKNFGFEIMTGTFGSETQTGTFRALIAQNLSAQTAAAATFINGAPGAINATGKSITFIPNVNTAANA
jgi:hypothetical protein